MVYLSILLLMNTGSFSSFRTIMYNAMVDILYTILGTFAHICLLTIHLKVVLLGLGVCMCLIFVGYIKLFSIVVVTINTPISNV